jgi:hypothetical protein
MASVTSRQGLKNYCLRRLGQPVVEINIDEDQLEERVDDAIEYFQEYHFDGVEKVFLKHLITQTDIDNEYIPMGLDANGNVVYPDGGPIISVVRVLPIPSFDSFQGGFFNEEYQLRLNDLNNFSGSSLIQWQMTLQNFSLVEQLFSIAPTMMFNRRQNRVYLEADWSEKFSVNDVLVIEAYRALNPSTYPEVWNDIFLKKYTTALIKRQWGENLKKFNGVVLPGGITLDGKTIYDEAVEEILKIEEEISLKYELPANGYVG